MNRPPPATESGRICALAALAQRDLQQQVAAYPELYAGDGFDPSLLTTVSLANAFSAPWLDAAALRVVNRTTLWAFAVDWLVDHSITAPTELAELTRRCLTVADGGPPDAGDALATFLGSIRDDLAKAPAFAALGHLWRDELRRMLAAMTTEWEWKRQVPAGAAGWPVTVDAYLDNADNLGSSFVNVAHWIATAGITTAEPDPTAQIPAVLTATRASQRVIRVLNDLATYRRDVSWGDLNLLMLDGGAAAARVRLAALVADHRRRLRPLRGSQLAFARFLDRQLEFCRGFYPVTDYWGDL